MNPHGITKNLTLDGVVASRIEGLLRFVTDLPAKYKTWFASFLGRLTAHTGPIVQSNHGEPGGKDNTKCIFCIVSVQFFRHYCLPGESVADLSRIAPIPQR